MGTPLFWCLNSQELLHAILAAYCSAGLPWHGDEILRMSQEELGVEVHVDPIKDLGISFFLVVDRYIIQWGYTIGI
jgi:hypothetical protein